MHLVHTERAVQEAHQSGLIDASVMELLLPDGRAHLYESFFYDYKLEFHRAIDIDASSLTEELLKDCVSFYNSMGGYLLLAFDEVINSELSKIIRDNDKINQQLHSAVGKSFSVKIYEKKTIVSGRQSDCFLIYIPKRPSKEKPLSFIKNSRNTGSSDKPKFVFKKGQIYCRYEHECKAANDDIELLSFAFSSREKQVDFETEAKTDNNLPPRDPALIQFVGRRDYLKSLWNWLAERRRPIKVLTAAGGLGKTTVAYEFAVQILDRPGAAFDKIVWLSGKKKTFSPLLGKLVPTTRCDFDGLDDFLASFLIQVGYNRSEINDAADREERVLLAIEAMSAFSILLIVDDVDSLERDEQNDLYALLSEIVIASNVRNDNSRVLFTSRLELMTGHDQRIPMGGFGSLEFREFLGVSADYMIEDPSIRKKVVEYRERIYDASAGSPIFTASIIRLVSLGIDLSTAIKDWRGKSGEQVRAFAFEREISQLTETQREILYALQHLSRARVAEIKEILNITSLEVEENLSILKNYHLYSVRGDPVKGTIVEVPEPIRLMYDVTAHKIDAVRRREIELSCAKLKSKNEDPDRRISLIVNQTVTHWKNNNHDVAEKYLTEQLGENPESGELYCMRARTRIRLPGRRYRDIESDFERAERLGCNPFALLKFWTLSRIKQKDWRGVLKLLERKKRIAEGFAIFNCCRVFAIIKLADKASTDARHTIEAEELYQQAVDAGHQYIGEGRAVGYFYPMRNLMLEAAFGLLRVVRNNASPDREKFEIFLKLRSFLDQGLAPSSLFRTCLENALKWIADTRATERITREDSRVIREDVEYALNYLRTQGKVRVDLVDLCDRVLQELKSAPAG